MLHYSLTYSEHMDRAKYVDPDRYKEGHPDFHPEMLCRTGDFHARGTRVIADADCPRCLVRLNSN